MQSQSYEVIFSGEVAPGVDPASAREAIQRLFKASDALLDRFFSGSPVVVKRDLDQLSAQKYQRAFNQAGAIVDVRPMRSPDSAAPAPAPAPASEAPVVPQAAAEQETVSPAAGAPLVPRDEYMAAFSHVQAPDFGVADAGADLLAEKPEVAAVEVDVSGMTLAPVGSDLEQLSSAEAVVSPDISHLKLQE